MKSRSGFTIVEIIVVIVVIAILAALATVGLIRLQTEPRDARRSVSVGLIMEAAEKYYDENGEYPFAEDLNPTGNITDEPNYDLIRSWLPSISNDIFVTEEYRFLPVPCWSTSDTNCANANSLVNSSTPGFLYFTAKKDGSTRSLDVLSATGCTIGGISSANSVAIIAWREESISGKWNFTKTKRGNATISGSLPPTVCEFGEV